MQAVVKVIFSLKLTAKRSLYQSVAVAKLKNLRRALLS
jgi:hypothetical protein